MSATKFIGQAMRASARTLCEGWARTTLGEVLELVNGRAYKQEELLAAGVPVLRIQNLNGGDRWYFSDLDLDPGKYCEAGDLLYAWSATFGPYRYKGPKAIFHYHIWRIVPGPSLDADFAYWLLKEITAEVKAAAHGVAMPHMTKAGMEAWPISLPPLNEQRRIVAKLEALQARSRRAREALDAVPPLLEKLRQSILAAAFRGDLTKDWRAKNKDVEPATELLKRIRAERKKKWEEAELAKMKAKGKPPTDDKWKAKYKEPAPVDASGLPELPKGWCWASVDELVAAIEAGRSPKAEGRPAGPGEPGVLKVSAVSWEEFDANENKALLNGEGIGDTPTVRAGDLLISRANTVQLVGATVIVRSDHPNLMLSDKTLRLVPSSKELPTELLLYGLRTREVRAVFEDDATGTSDSMRNLSQEKIRTAPVAVPPALEARVLVEKVNSAMEIRRSSGAQSDVIVEGLVRLERALLAKAFRGELVPQDPNDEPADAMLARSGSPQEVLCVPERLTENRSRRRGKSA